MTPEQIRAEYVETLIAHSNPELHGQHCPVSKTKGKSTACDCWRRGQINEQVDALAEAGLLPTAVGYRSAYEPDGTPLGYTERQLLTDWQRTIPPNYPGFPDSSPLESGGQTKPMRPRPHIGTSEAAE